MHDRLSFSSLDEATAYLGGLPLEQSFVSFGEQLKLVIGAGDNECQVRFSKRSLLQLQQLYNEEQQKLEQQLMGLQGFSVNPLDYPEIDRLQLAHDLLADETNSVPAIISSFNTGLTYDTNLLTHVPAGLGPEIVRQICNISYFPDDQYQLYAKNVLAEHGGWAEQRYVARKAGTGELMRYTTRARAFRVKGFSGLYRYAQTMKAPESIE